MKAIREIEFIGRGLVRVVRERPFEGFRFRVELTEGWYNYLREIEEREKYEPTPLDEFIF